MAKAKPKVDKELQRYLITARISKKKANVTSTINLLNRVLADAKGYRQNLELILKGEELVKLLKQYRQDLEL